jgi:hypothetical protein
VPLSIRHQYLACERENPVKNFTVKDFTVPENLESEILQQENLHCDRAFCTESSAGPVH